MPVFKTSLIISKIIDSYLTYKISQNKTFLNHNEIDFNEILNYDKLSSLNRMVRFLFLDWLILTNFFIRFLRSFIGFVYYLLLYSLFRLGFQKKLILLNLDGGLLKFYTFDFWVSLENIEFINFESRSTMLFLG